MNIRRMSILLIVSLIVLCIWGVALLMLAPTAQANRQVIHFNGQTLDLTDAANVQVQSTNDTRVFDADQHGGVVTVTTSIVTVTIWMKP